MFSLVSDADPTKRALFSLSGITTVTTRTFTRPNTSSELAILGGTQTFTQTFTGNKTFSGTLSSTGTVTVSAAAATIGTATTTATYGIGTGTTTTGVTKTLNLGTGGASGSTTVVNIGSATAGSGGTTVVNTPSVTFANAVTQVGMPQTNLTAQLLALGGATADSYNRLSINAPAILFSNAGAGIEATVNKSAAGNDAAFAFKTGFSARALIELLGSDDFSFKVRARPGKPGPALVQTAKAVYTRAAQARLRPSGQRSSRGICGAGRTSFRRPSHSGVAPHPLDAPPAAPDREIQRLD